MYGRFVAGVATTDTFTHCLSRWWISAIVSIVLIAVWLWLSAISGILLRIVCRFDRSLNWLTRNLDLKVNPLRSIGLVTGALTAVVHWLGALIVCLFW